MMYLALMIALTGGLWDAFTGKIPNWLTLGSIFLGLIASLILGDLANCIAGLLIGIVIYLPFFVLGYMGGGDVKLMGAIGCFAGIEGIIYTAFFASIWGGLLALIALYKRKRHVRYGMAIGLGFLTLKVLLWLNWQLPSHY